METYKDYVNIANNFKLTDNCNTVINDAISIIEHKILWDFKIGQYKYYVPKDMINLRGNIGMMSIVCVEARIVELKRRLKEKGWLFDDSFSVDYVIKVMEDFKGE